MTTYPVSLPRVLALLVLSGLSFQSGRWVEQLTSRGAAPEDPPAVVPPATAEVVTPTALAEPVPGTTAGSPEGSGDLITPLSARDPTSLIMGPGAGFKTSCPIPPHLLPRGGFIAPDNY